MRPLARSGAVVPHTSAVVVHTASPGRSPELSGLCLYRSTGPIRQGGRRRWLPSSTTRPPTFDRGAGSARVPPAQPPGRGVAARRHAAVARRHRRGRRAASTPTTSTSRRTATSTTPSRTLYAAGEPVDPVTVADELRRAGPARRHRRARPRCVSLQANTPATSNAGRYAKIVEEHALLRRLIGVAGEIAEMGYDLPDDVTKTVDHAESHGVRRRPAPHHRHHGRRSTTCSTPTSTGSSSSTSGATPSPVCPPATPTSTSSLSGLQPNALIVRRRPALGWARPAFALGMATHAALEANRPVLLFSLEMSQLELTQRMLCAEARVDSKQRAQRQPRPRPTGRRSPTPPAAWPRRRSGSTTTRTSPSWRSGPRPGGSRARIGDLGPGRRRLPPADDRPHRRPRTVRSRCPRSAAASRSSPASSSAR